MRETGQPGARDGTRFALLLFLLLTFAATWSAWFVAVVALEPGRRLSGFNGPLFLAGVYAPAFVALLLTAYSEGRAGVLRLLSRIGRWRVAARYYLFAITFMLATKLLAAAVHRIVRGAWPAFGNERLPLMIAAAVLLTWVQFGEEIGWRGYALPRLATHLGLGGASILLGLIWALWHLPLFYLPGSTSEGQSFPIYLLHVTATSVVLAWLYWKTEGSLLLVMLMHSSINNTTGIVPAATPNAVDALSLHGSIVAWATVAIASAVAVFLLYRMRGARIDALLDSEMPAV